MLPGIIPLTAGTSVHTHSATYLVAQKLPVRGLSSVAVPTTSRQLKSAGIAMCAAILVSVSKRVQLGTRRGMGTIRAHMLRAAKATGHENTALVFVKPHAVVPGVLELVPRFLQERGASVLRNGTVDATEIDVKGIIDSHYAAIARIGMARDIKALGLSESAAERFKEGYGITMDDALTAGKLYSAVTAMEALSVNPTELLDQCLAAGYEKLGSGLYAARLKAEGLGDVYVLNGFYARMREKYVAPGVVVHWFVISFSADKLPWKRFRREVIGATNPPDADSGSLRGAIRDRWEALGLREPPNYQDNGIHASAGPLEALREREVWLGDKVGEDTFAIALKQLGVNNLSSLLENPLVELNGEQGRAFDLLEDVDAGEALDLLPSVTLLEGSSA